MQIRIEFATQSQAICEGMTLKTIRIQDIRSLTDFHRNTKEHLTRLRRSGRPEVLTINGKAELVVQNAAAYQRLLETSERKNVGRRKNSQSIQVARTRQEHP